MNELSVTLVVFSLVLVFIYKVKDYLVNLYLLSFFSYYYIGWHFAWDISLSQLAFYNLTTFMFILGSCYFYFYKSFNVGNNNAILYTIPESGLKFNSLVIFSLLSLFLIAVGSYLFLVLSSGIPILNINERKEVSGFYTYLIGLFWVVYPFFYVGVNKKFIVPLTILIVLLLLTMGYRTPLVIVLFIFIILNFKYKRVYINRWAKLFFIVAFLFIVTIYPLVRFQDDPEAVIKLLKNLDLSEDFFFLAPMILVFAEGAAVIKGLFMISPDIGFQYGSFTLAGFSTILPGEQMHSRTLLSYWLGRTNWQESTTTSSLLGQFYIEFGKTGAVFLCFLLGLLLTRGCYYFNRSRSIFYEVFFLIKYIFLLISIHTGFLDPIVLYVLTVYFIIYIMHKIGEICFPKK